MSNAAAILMFVLFIGGIVVAMANRNDKNKKKIQQHIRDGNIDRAVLDGYYPSTPADTTRQTFRDLTNKQS